VHLFVNYVRSVHNYVLCRACKKGSLLMVNLIMLLTIREVEVEYGYKLGSVNSYRFWFSLSLKSE
jgi:hypothetical protein